MKIANRQQLTGVNRWFRNRTFAAVVTGLPEETVATDLLRTLAAALDRLPLPAHQAGAGERMQRAMPSGAGWGRCLIELAAELQFLSGEVVGARTVQRTASAGSVHVALECQEFPLAEACLDAAVRICVRLHCGESIELAKVYDDLAACAGEACLGGSTGPIVAAARRRGIPSYRLDRESLVQLGDGVHQQRICTAITSRTSQIAVQVSTDKHLVSQQWSRIGIPVAADRLVHDEEEAIRAAEEVGWPVVVKPADADYGRGVSLHLRTAEQVRAAYPKAKTRSHSGRVLVQHYLQGASHRLLVIEGRLAAAVRRDPIAIVGDGRHNVRELVEEANRDGRWGLERPLSLGDDERAALAEVGFAPETIPASGVKVPLSHDLLENYSNVTERVHPDTRELAFDAARVIGLDVAGLDVIALDISRPLAEQGGGFLEINAQPAIAIHRPPHCDRPQAVGDAIVASLFPPPACGRAPLIIALGGRQADHVVPFTAEFLRRGGNQVTTSTPHQTLWNHRPLAPGSPSLADRLATLMLHPRTEVAVLSASLAEILQTGLGADQCHVLVLADGSNGARTGDGDEGMELLRQLVPASRRCVVNLDDPRWSGCAAVSIPTTVLVSSDPTHPRLSQHLATGRVAAFPHGTSILVRAGEVELARFPAPDASPSIRGAQALAAAAVFALGLEGLD
ncbi:MAG TPA: acetate--CoA ligase family protein [Gemmataceae bacterium]|jgi:cyanophycin synthetase